MILLFREYHPYFHISKHVPNNWEVLGNAWGRSENKYFLASQPNCATGTDDYEIKSCSSSGKVCLFLPWIPRHLFDFCFQLDDWNV